MFTRRKKVGYVVPRSRKLQFEALERRTLLSAANPQDLLGGSLPAGSAVTNSTSPAAGTMQYCYIVNNAAALAAASAAAAGTSSANGSIAAADSAPASGTSTPVGFTPAQIRTAYGVDKLSVGMNGGAGQTIAIIDTYDDPSLVSSTHPGTDSAFAASDFGKFDAAMGLPDPPSFLKVNENGATSPLPAASGTSGWSVEESLDVEWAHAMAPAANIILIECSSASDADLISAPMASMGTAASLASVSVVSMSFGRNENSSDATLDSAFTTPTGHTPITYLASTGDSGAPGGFPAYSPNVVAVGGTTLTLGTGNVWANETGWSWNATYGWGTGGGRSSYETEPSYQNSVQTSGYREIPDVSFVADPLTGVAVYDSYDNGSSTPWEEVGGTSLSSPCWAGLIAVSGQLRATAGLPTLDGRLGTLPSLYKLPATDFHDISVGNNNGYSAGPGYDMVTGIGSPKADLLLPALVGVTSKGTVAFSANSYEIGTSTTVTVSDLDLAGNPSCSVTLTSTAGDSETLSLTAQGGGVFTGSIATSAGSVVSGDGALETVPGGTITVAYHDANDGTGNPATVTATATSYTVGRYAFSTISSPQTAGMPFSVTATAYDTSNNPIPGYAGTVPLSASGSGGTLSVSPATVTFSGGTWTGNVTVNAVDPTLTLRLNNGAGANSVSNTFATQAGPATSFQWSTVASPQTQNLAFPVTLTAKDANGYTATSYNGSATVGGWVNGAANVVPAPGAVSGTGNIKLQGTDLKLGVNADGSLIDQDLSLGANFLGNEFLLPGTPFSAFTLAINGTDYHNSAASSSSSNPVTMTVQNVSTTSVQHANATGTAGGVNITRDIWFQPGSDVVTFQVKLQNTTAAALSKVAWMEAYDPDQGYGLAGDYTTANTVLFGGQYVEAVYYYSPTYPNGLTIAMGSNDARTVAGAQGWEITDPFTVINSPVNPGGVSADVNSNLAFNIGTLAAGASTTVTYYMVFATDRAVAANLYQSQLRTAVPVTPATVNFTAGVATTNMTVQQTATGMYLEADGTGGQVGTSNNFNVLALPPLTLTAPANTTEGDPAATGTVSIPTALTSDLVISLSSSDPSRLKVPASVTIPAGKTSTSVSITTFDDSLLNGPEAVTITATATGYLNGTGTVEVHDNETAVMNVTLPGTAVENSGSISGKVTASAAPANSITIQLASSDTTRLTVPATVVLPAGQTSVNFTATLLDDHKIEGGPTPVTVTSTMDNWTSGLATVSIQDSDTTLAVSLPASGWEGQTAAGTVTLGGTLTTPLTVYLSSSDTTQLTVPASVTVPAGQTTASFTATLIDNGLRTGPQTEHVTATATGLSTGTGSIVVKDADVDHYTFSAIASPQVAGVPFAVTAHAYDVLNNSITVYNATVPLSATGLGGTLSASPASVAFASGAWTGTVTVNAADPSAVLRLNNGAGATGASNAFATQANVVNLSGEWHTFGDGPSHTGYISGGLGNNPLTSLLWSKSITSNQVAVAGGRVYVTPDTSSLVALDETTGAQLWSYPFTSVFSLNPPTYDSGHVYMQSITGNEIGQLWSFDAVTGATTWTSSFGCQWEHYYAPTVANGSIWVDAGTYGGMYGYNQTTGAQLFFDSEAQYDEWTPTYYNGKVYSWVAGTFTESNATTGAANWSVSLGWNWSGWSMNTCSAIDNNRAFLVGTTGLFAVDLNAHAQLWSIADSGFSGSPAVQGNTVYAIHGTQIRAYNVATGALIGSFDTGQTLQGQPIVTDDSLIVASSTKTFMIRRNDMHLLNTVAVGGSLAVANNLLFVASSGTLYAYALYGYPPLSVSVPTDITEGQGTINGTLSITAASATDLVVSLVSSDPTRLTVPATLTIPAGKTSVPLPVTVIQDSLLNGPEAVTIASTATGYNAGTGTVEVHDNQTATIGVTLPASAHELSGTVTGTVTCSAPPSQNITVQLSSSDATRLTVPATVVLPAGKTSVNFTATLLNDHIIEGGPTSITVTPLMDNWPMVAATISVLDDNATIAVSLPASAWEGQTAAGTVTLGGSLTTPLTVNLNSSDTTLLTLPATVTVPAGQTTANFTATLPDNGVREGPKPVTVTATASGLTTGTTSITVNDADLDHYTWTAIAATETAGAPFSVTVRAYDVLNNLISVYNGAAALSGAGQGGALSISPTTITFVNGVWTGNVTVNAVDPTVTLTLNDGAGHKATSNVFATQPGPVASFQWSTITSPQYAAWPVTATITAKDAHGYTATSYNGPVNLTAQNGPGTVTVGTGTTTWYPPLYTSYYDCRTQVIYLASDLRGAGPISSLALYVTTLPGQVMNGWTIRMQETPLSSYSTYAWAGSGWTTVYQANQTISATGWVTFNFTTPFNYDGAQNLMIDFSFHNTSSSSAGYCYATSTTATRSIYYYANGTYGDPKNWSGTTSPAPYATTYIPNVRLMIGGPIGITPSTTGNFTSGVWTGSVTLATANAAAWAAITASDGSGHTGATNTFTLLTQPVVSLALPAGATEGVGTVTGWLGIPFALGSDLTVSLVSSDPTRLTVPAIETIPAGQTLISFPISIVPTGLLDGPETVTVTTSAPKFANGTGTITVHSNESATLSVSLPPSAMETDGPVTGTVTASAAPAQDIAVQLTSSGPGHLAVPATVTLPAGQTTVNFTATPIDDHVINTLPAAVTVTAAVDNWVDGTATIAVLDNDHTLAVSLPASAWEGQAATGTITLGGTSTTPLTVYLASSDTTQLTVPASVTVPAGQATASFPVTLIDNGLRTGPQTETVTATAGGFPSGAANISVKDADVDHYAFATISGPQADGAAFSVTARAYDVMNNPITVYNSSVPLSATGQGGKIAVSPATANFASGVWTGSVTVNGVDPAVVLTLNNGAGATGSSGSFAVQPGAVASFSWDTITSPKGVSIPFSASLTAKDVNGYTVTTYNSTAALSGAVGTLTTASNLGQPTPTTYYNNGTYSLGYTFTPAATITVTDVLHYFGTKISIWTNSGTLVTSQTFPASGPGWIDTPLATPVQLTGGVTYRIADYTAGQNYYVAPNQISTTPLGTIGQECEVSGDGFPTNLYSTYYCVDIVAQVGTYTSVPIAPAGATFVNGKWTGNVTVSQVETGMHLHIDDGSGHTGDSNTFNVAANATAVVGRYVFYAGSAWDGNQAAPNPNDDAAIAPDKTALLPGGTASFANYTSYSRGINGIMIDVQNLAGTPTAADFIFKVGNSNTPGSWTAAPAPTSITVRSGAGRGGSSRIEIVWTDGAIAKEWLQVTVLADAKTGLTAKDVFYWGNAVGDTGNSSTDTYVNATDEILARHNLTASAGTINVEDFNRDGAVDASDVAIVRGNGTNFMSALKLMTMPTTPFTNDGGPGATTAVVTSSAATAVLGTSPTLTAVVNVPNSAATPTGQVDFVDATTGADLGLAMLDATGRATLTAPALAVGMHGIVAVYAGDETFSGSESTPFTVTIIGSATWTGDGYDANWSTAANWGGVTLAAGMPLSFTGSGGAATNDLAALQVNGIAFPAESGPFVLRGNSVSFMGNITNASPATQTIAISMALDGCDATLNSVSGVLKISGDISSSGGAYGIQKTGAGTVVLSGHNSYAGGTIVADGTLVIATDTALPSGTDLTVGDWSSFAPNPNQTNSMTPSGTEQVSTAAAALTQPVSSAVSAASDPANASVAVAAQSAAPAVAAATVSLQPQASGADQVYSAMARSAPAATDNGVAMRAAAAVLAGLQANKDADGDSASARLQAVDAVLAQWQ